MGLSNFSEGLPVVSERRKDKTSIEKQTFNFVCYFVRSLYFSVACETT